MARPNLLLKKYPNMVILPKNLKMSDRFKFEKDEMELYNIPKIIPDDPSHKDEEEFWAYCKFDKDKKIFNKEKRYIISSFGRVYDLYRRKLVSEHDSTGWSQTSSGMKYRRVNITHLENYRKHYFVHRLVAITFLEKVRGKDVVDHIDEIPYHNYVWNLQWVDKSTNSNKHNMYVNRERTGKMIDTTWKYEELVVICKMMAEGHKATYIYNEMLKLTNNNPKIQYERIRTLYKHIMRRGDFHDIAVKCGVKFESNTLKEKSSVAKVQAEKENLKNNNPSGELKPL